MEAKVFQQKIPPAWKGRKYKLERRENYDEMLKELGFNIVSRKVATSITNMTVQLVKEGDEYTWIVKTKTFVGGGVEIKFRNGVEFEESLPMGPKVKAVMQFDGDNKLKHTRYMTAATVVMENDFSETQLVKVRQFCCCCSHRV